MGKESVAIHLYVPMCPNCGAKLDFYEATQNFLCHCCKMSYSIIAEGQTDREIICKTGEKEYADE